MKPSDGYDPLLEQAAIWAQLLKCDDTPEHRRAYANWLMRDASHVRASLLFDVGVQLTQDLEATPNDHSDRPIIELGNTAVAARPLSRPLVGPRSANTRRLRWMVAAAGLAAAAGVALFSLRPLAPSQRAQIAPPPQAQMDGTDRELDSPQFVHLTPGTLLRVDDHSLVRIHRTPPGGHIVTVVHGTAYFSGRHDKDQPLQVLSGRVAVDPVGTSFSVKNEHGFTDVVVASGAVQLTCGPQPDATASPQSQPGGSKKSQRTIPLGVNTLAHLASDDCNRKAQTRALTAAASDIQAPPEDGLVLFKDTPVKEAAETFNRASTRYLFVVDQDVEKDRVGGYFHITELDDFLRALEQLGIHAIRERSVPEGLVVRLVSTRRVPRHRVSTRSANDTAASQH